MVTKTRAPSEKRQLACTIDITLPVWWLTSDGEETEEIGKEVLRKDIINVLEKLIFDYNCPTIKMDFGEWLPEVKV